MLSNDAIGFQCPFQLLSSSAHFYVLKKHQYTIPGHRVIRGVAVILDPVIKNIFNVDIIVIGLLLVVLQCIDGFSKVDPNGKPLAADVLYELECTLLFPVLPFY